MRIIQQTQQLVKATIGIDLDTVGNSCLTRGLKERMAQSGMEDEASYLELLRNSPMELEELVEYIVVPETWFFRDEKPFNALQQYVKEEWLPTKPFGPIKILSIPCSTGEEPYTIAMALLDIGLSPEQLKIDAVDISKIALEKARRAIYRANSFRSRDIGFRDRYFRQTEDGYVLDEKIRRTVAFAHGNILSPGFFIGKGPYHAVFFRNLMIYLAPPQQDKAMAVIDRLLDPSGILFVGHAESLQPINKGYTPVRYPFGFAYRKNQHAGHKATIHPLGSAQHRASRQQSAGLAGLAVRSPLKPSRKPAELRPAVTTAKSDPLALAFELADKGKTDEARKLCEMVLDSHPPRAEAYYLLGLLLETQGLAAESERCLQKAVYLEPEHVDALAHLALAAAWRGDAKSADLFRQRARRAEEKFTRD